MATARELVSDAYIASGLVGYDDSIEGLELDVGLKRLNSLISEWQNKELMCYTRNRLELDFNFNKSDVTIGDFNAFKVKSIFDDGFRTETKLQTGASDLYDSVISFSGLTNYVNDRPVLEILDSTVITAPQAIPAAEIINFIEVDANATINMSDTSSFSVGDSIICTDESFYTIQGEITSLTSTDIVISDSNYIYYSKSQSNIGGSIFKYIDRVVQPKESVGYMYDNSFEVADVIQPRPNQLKRVMRKTSDAFYELTIVPSTDWNYNYDNLQNSSPSYVTYYTDYPYGTIRFDSKINETMILEYFKLLDVVFLDDEIILPPAYYSAFRDNLAVVLCKINGKSPNLIQQDAINALDALKRQNITIPTIEAFASSGSRRGRGTYNIKTNGYY